MSVIPISIDGKTLPICFLQVVASSEGISCGETAAFILIAMGGSKDNSLQAMELSGHQTCKLWSSHPFKGIQQQHCNGSVLCFNDHFQK